MHFGKTLKKSRYEPWAVHYLDYGQLKSLLKQGLPDESSEFPSDPTLSPKKLGSSSDHPSMGSLTVQWSRHGLPSFVHFLNGEVERIVLFFLREKGRVAEELAACRNEQLHQQQQDSSMWLTSTAEDQMANVGGHTTTLEEETLFVRYYEVAMHLLRVMQYVELNVTGIRKILKKHDKKLHTNLSAVYVGRRAVVLKPLLSNDSLDTLTSVLESSLKEWSSFREQKQRVLAGHGAEFGLAKVPEMSERSHSGSDLRLLPVQDEATANGEDARSHDIVPSTPDSYQLGKVPFSRSIHTAFLQQAHVHQIEKSPLVVLQQIRTARKRLHETSEFVNILAASMLVMPSTDSLSDAEDDEDQERPSQFSNILNLLSTFFYMANYYIVAPSANTYAERLGSSPSLSGMIIGCTPVAALFSTLLYSWWTSYSYKSALVFASVCSLTGNLCYALGLPMQSLTLVLIGRLLNGFGSARSINRRYIADSYSSQERTAASATFVTAGALGMAVGPFTAAILEVTIDNDGSSSYWQVENAPGWIMFVVWSVYLVCLLWGFQDPPKRVPKPKERSKPPQDSANDEDTLSERTGLLRSNSDALIDINLDSTMMRDVPIYLTFLIYFVLKLVLESILSSTATLTYFYFGWTGKVSGLFLAALGLLILPANLGIAHLSTIYEDRDLIWVMQIAMLSGCLAVLQYRPHHYTIPQYILASVIIFVSTNALEGPNMSLLSKVIPKSWRTGFFNVGLLSTEAGTLGRAVGDVLLTVCGSYGLEYLLNSTFIIMAVLSIATLILTHRYFAYLVPLEKDD